MANITFEKLENYKSGSFECPVLKVNNPESDSFKKDGYLAPFRFYKFQVSGSYEGRMDLGSGEVTQFKHIVMYKYKNRAIEELTKELVRALNAYLQTCYGYNGKTERAYSYKDHTWNIGYYNEKNIQYDEIYRIEDEPILMQFVEDTYYAVKKYYEAA